MKVTHDKEADIVNVYFKEIEAGEISYSVPVANDHIILDFDKNGKLLGFEVLAPSKYLPQEFVEEVEVPDYFKEGEN